MTEPSVDASRRAFLRTAAGTASVAAVSGSAAAAEDGGGGSGGGAQPDYGGYLSGANGNTSTVDQRGQSEVTIQVGAGSQGLAFSPAAVWVDAGTTITWEWTGEGGRHNVVGESIDFRSGDPVSEAGATFEQTFEESQIVTYYCSPHESLGMLGAIAVGEDIPTVQPDTGGGAPALPENAKTLGIASGFAMVSTLGLAYFFMRYGGDYDE